MHVAGPEVFSSTGGMRETSDDKTMQKREKSGRQLVVPSF